MNTILRKAFQVTTCEWWQVDCGTLEDAWSEIIYANTAGKARYSGWLRSEMDKEYFLKFKVRRRADMDLLTQPPHSLALTINARRLDKMKHAYGFDSHIPGFRNYYATRKDEDWQWLTEAGYAERGKTDPTNAMEYYHLSELGIEIIKSLLPVKRSHRLSTL